MNELLETNEIIKHIINQYGTNIFHEEKKFYSVLMDLMGDRTKERNILKIALSAGITDKMLLADKMDNDDKRLLCSECKLILCDNYGIEEKWSDFAVNCLSYALGWTVNKKISSDKQNIMLADVIRKLYNSE